MNNKEEKEERERKKCPSKYGYWELIDEAIWVHSKLLNNVVINYKLPLRSWAHPCCFPLQYAADDVCDYKLVLGTCSVWKNGLLLLINSTPCGSIIPSQSGIYANTFWNPPRQSICQDAVMGWLSEDACLWADRGTLGPICNDDVNLVISISGWQIKTFFPTYKSRWWHSLILPNYCFSEILFHYNQDLSLKSKIFPLSKVSMYMKQSYPPAQQLSIEKTISLIIATGIWGT